MAMAVKLLEGEESHRFLSFDMTATKAADAGMVCGGAVRVLLQRVTPDQLQFFQRLDQLRSQGERPVLITVMSGEESPILDVWSAREGLEGMNLPDALAEELVRKAAKARQSFSLEGDDLRVFAEPVINPSVLHLVGAGHVALATAKVAAFAGFEVGSWTTGPSSQAWSVTPRPARCGCWRALTAASASLGPMISWSSSPGHLHDRDVLAQALKTGARYIGMIGSRSKRDAVYRSLLESGYTEADLDRVFCPIGLSIGADTPEEIAVSIVAEMIGERAGIGR
jgi:Xanthine and CO dehydrogenases maturation factor, XdhC/CoxF family